MAKIDSGAADLPRQNFVCGTDARTSNWTNKLIPLKMAPYDSDSSGGEEEDYTETNVLLGYASPDANGEEISRLGGHPVCLSSTSPVSKCLLTSNSRTG